MHTSYFEKLIDGLNIYLRDLQIETAPSVSCVAAVLLQNSEVRARLAQNWIMPAALEASVRMDIFKADNDRKEGIAQLSGMAAATAIITAASLSDAFRSLGVSLPEDQKQTLLQGQQFAEKAMSDDLAKLSGLIEELNLGNAKTDDLKLLTALLQPNGFSSDQPVMRSLKIFGLTAEKLSGQANPFLTMDF